MRRYGTAGAFVLLGALWGTSFPVTRLGLDVLPPVLFAALRFDVVAVLVLAFAARSTERWLPRGTDWWAVVVSGVSFVALHHALLFAGQRTVPSALAAVRKPAWRPMTMPM